MFTPIPNAGHLTLHCYVGVQEVEHLANSRDSSYRGSGLVGLFRGDLLALLSFQLCRRITPCIIDSALALLLQKSEEPVHCKTTPSHNNLDATYAEIRQEVWFDAFRNAFLDCSDLYRRWCCLTVPT